MRAVRSTWMREAMSLPTREDASRILGIGGLKIPGPGAVPRLKFIQNPGDASKRRECRRRPGDNPATPPTVDTLPDHHGAVRLPRPACVTADAAVRDAGLQLLGHGRVPRLSGTPKV
eukprot:gene17845-biopygen1316